MRINRLSSDTRLCLCQSGELLGDGAGLLIDLEVEVALLSIMFEGIEAFSLRL